MKRITLLVVVLACCSLVMWSYANVNSGGRIRLGIYGTPSPGTTFSVVCTLTADVDTSTVALAEVWLDSGLRTPAGDSLVTFSVPIEPGVPAVSSHEVIGEEAGVFHVRAKFACAIDTTIVVGDNDVAWISVSTDPDSQGLNLSATYPVPTAIPTNELPGAYDFIEYVPIAPSPMDSSVNLGEGNDGYPADVVDISVRYVYYNFSVHQTVPLVNATVELWDDDDICGDDDFLGREMTDETGLVVFHNIDTGDCGPTNDIDPKFRALLDNSVVRMIQGNLEMWVAEYKPPPNQGSWNYGTYEVSPRKTPLTYACAAFDNINRIWTLLHSAGRNMPKREVVTDLSVGQSEFHPSPPRIRLRPADTEIFDVVGHEYGHAVMHWFGDYSAFEDHRGFDVVTNTVTGWQEGFASFLPVALNDDGAFNFAVSSVPMESLHSGLEGRSSDDARRTQGLVARALYDLFDNHVDTNLFDWQVGADVYAGGVGPILDVLYRSNVPSGITAFWTAWHAWSPNPGQDPIRAIRLNMIDLNTPPVWTTATTFVADPFDDVVLDLWALVSDGQSRDPELLLELVSKSNGSVQHEWLDNGRRLLLRLPTQSGEGNCLVVLRADDKLATTQVTLNVAWTYDPGHGGDGPPEPCEYPCQGQWQVPRAVLSLDGAHPNPFRDHTSVAFSLPDRQRATVAVYDVTGRLVRTLASQTLDRGLHEKTWDGLDEAGAKVPSGVYFGVLRTGGDQLVRKIIVLR